MILADSECGKITRTELSNAYGRLWGVPSLTLLHEVPRAESTPRPPTLQLQTVGSVQLWFPLFVFCEISIVAFCMSL